MEKLVRNMGKLTKLKQPNRDLLAKKIGWDKPNMLKALAGERPVPYRYMSGLRKELGLSDSYRLVPDEVHGLIVSDGEAQANMLIDVLEQFTVRPIIGRWLLRGIPEYGGDGLAYVLEDSQKTLIVVRNDDALLFCPDQCEHAKEETARVLSDIFDATQAVEREAPMILFERIFAGYMTVADVWAMLNRETKVWTWGRIAERARRDGWDAHVAADRLGLME